MRVDHEFAPGRGGYLYLISGSLDANGTAMKTGDAAYVRGAGSLDLAATATSELLLVDTPL
jgi:redox-sensitive bicupin YhaK (pirin superfamily)